MRLYGLFFWSPPNHTPIKYIGVELGSNWITPWYLIQVLCYKLKQRTLLRYSLIFYFAGRSFSWKMNVISTNNGKWEEEEAGIGTLPLTFAREWGKAQVTKALVQVDKVVQMCLLNFPTKSQHSVLGWDTLRIKFSQPDVYETLWEYRKNFMSQR